MGQFTCEENTLLWSYKTCNRIGVPKDLSEKNLRLKVCHLDRAEEGDLNEVYERK
jgi:hypothetical protein